MHARLPYLCSLPAGELLLPPLAYLECAEVIVQCMARQQSVRLHMLHHHTLHANTAQQHVQMLAGKLTAE